MDYIGFEIAKYFEEIKILPYIYIFGAFLYQYRLELMDFITTMQMDFVNWDYCQLFMGICLVAQHYQTDPTLPIF